MYRRFALEKIFFSLASIVIVILVIAIVFYSHKENDTNQKEVKISDILRRFLKALFFRTSAFLWLMQSFLFSDELVLSTQLPSSLRPLLSWPTQKKIPC